MAEQHAYIQQQALCAVLNMRVVSEEAADASPAAHIGTVTRHDKHHQCQLPIQQMCKRDRYAVPSEDFTLAHYQVRIFLG